MPKLNVMNMNGQNVGEIELVDSILNVEVNEHVLYEVVKNQLANKRQGTQSAKTRAEVRGRVNAFPAASKLSIIAFTVATVASSELSNADA